MLTNWQRVVGRVTRHQIQYTVDSRQYLVGRVREKAGTSKNSGEKARKLKCFTPTPTLASITIITCVNIYRCVCVCVNEFHSVFLVFSASTLFLFPFYGRSAHEIGSITHLKSARENITSLTVWLTRNIYFYQYVIFLSSCLDCIILISSFILLFFISFPFLSCHVIDLLTIDSC